MSTTSGSTSTPSSNRTPVRRVDAVLGPIVWWAAHLGGSYWLVPRTCATDATWPLHVLTVVIVALIARAGWSGLRVRRAGLVDPGSPHAQRDVFIGWFGIVLAVFFGGVTVAAWLPVLFIDPCW